MAPSGALENPAVPAAQQPRRPISVAGLEVVIARAVALFGLLFGAQSLPAAIGQRDQLHFGWWLTTIVGIYGLLVVSLVAAIIRRGRTVVNAALAAVFLIALVFWIPGVGAAGWSAAERPWLWFMITVATAAAAVAFPVWLATVYLLLTPTLYGVLRLTQFGGSADVAITTLDVAFAVLLGGAVLVMITMLRSAAAGVDAAQSTALSRYLEAVGEHAREVERVQVDAIVHDTVLSAFLTAGRARTEEDRSLATVLARNAIVHLKSADVALPDGDAGIPAETVARRITEADTMMRADFRLDMDELGGVILPGIVAESVYSATLQAMVNSSQHAGAGDHVRRWILVRSRPGGGIHVEVGDSGVGFALAEVPTERLGVRVSILERMRHADGHASVESTPGKGTRVVIDWPAPDPVETEDETGVDT